MRAAVDVLTLSATPIPRTLHMAFSGSGRELIAPPRGPALDPHLRRPLLGETIRERWIGRSGGAGRSSSSTIGCRPSRDGAVPARAPPDARIAVGHGRWTRRPCPSHGRLRCASRRHPPVHRDHRGRAGPSQREHDPRESRAPVRAGPAVPAPGPRGRDRHRAYAYYIVPKDVALTRDATRRLAVLEELTDSARGSGRLPRPRDPGRGNLLERTSRTDPPGRVRAVHAAALRGGGGDLGIASRRRRAGTGAARPGIPSGRLHRRGRRALEFYRKLSSAKTVDAADEIEMPCWTGSAGFPPRRACATWRGCARECAPREWRSSSAGRLLFSPLRHSRSTGRTWSPG